MRRRGVFWTLAAPLIGAALILGGCPPRMDDFTKLSKDANDYFETGRYEKAVDAYTQALNLRPDEPGILANRGNARMMLEDYEGALVDYEAALRLDSAFGKAYANRGILRDRMGDTEGAIADYRKALELEPELGVGPGILKRILYDPPTETIKDRLEYLEAMAGVKE